MVILGSVLQPRSNRDSSSARAALSTAGRCFSILALNSANGMLRSGPENEVQALPPNCDRPPAGLGVPAGAFGYGLRPLRFSPLRHSSMLLGWFLPLDCLRKASSSWAWARLESPTIT